MNADIARIIDGVFETLPPLPATLAELQPAQRRRIERHASACRIGDSEALAALRVAELKHAARRQETDALDALVASLC